MIFAGRRASDRERAARRGAALHQAEKHFGQVSSTGLAKLCDRCNRIGWVYQHAGGEFVVVWDGPGHRPDRPDMSRVAERELFSPDSGCHYCHPLVATQGSLSGAREPEEDGDRNAL
ncbi:MAG TPA: hypothetical protein VMK42_14115 [Anaeromyxobacteraceae bacterium]|nr:hypothetical protein [Anaeromyxobacteraceae bacterium]